MSPQAPEDLQRSLRFSFFDAFLYSLMVGIGETYLPAFALSVGLPEIFAGILSTLPLVSGAVLQIFTPRALRRLGSPKTWVVITVVLQALAFIPLIYYSQHVEDVGFWPLFFVFTLYWGAGFSAGPAWNYWMGHLVPKHMQQEYFSRRARLTQFGILIGLVLGGIALHNKLSLFSFTSVFGGLFLVACVARLASSWALSRKIFRKEWSPPAPMGLRESWLFFWSRREKRNFFLLLFPFVTMVYVSAPFVVPYFLAQLKMDYGTFMFSIATLMIGKIVALFVIERWVRVKSGARLFALGLIAVSPAPAFWWLSTSLEWILFLQLASGAAWAFYEVGLSLICVGDLKAEEKVPFLSVFNIVNSAGIITGTLIGARLLSALGESIEGYLWLFFIGGIARLLFAAPVVRAARRIAAAEEQGALSQS